MHDLFYLLNTHLWCWVLVAACGLSPVAARGLLTAESCCGAQALVHSLYLLLGTCSLPRPGVEPVSPASAGGSLSTVPPKGKVLVVSSCLSLCDPRDCSPPGSSVHRTWNTGVGSHPLLQGTFPTPGSNPALPHCRQTLLSEPYCATREVLQVSAAFSLVSSVPRGPNPSRVLQQLLALQPEQQLNVYGALKTHLLEKGILQPALKV